MAEHTQGKWIVSGRVAVIGGDRYLVVTAPETRWVSLVMEDSPSSEEDARLIAAAPDLLSALQGVVASLHASEEHDGHKPVWKAVFAAIARATQDGKDEG